MAQHVINNRGIKTVLPKEKIIKYHSNKDPDVVLVVNDEQFHCHREILASHSPYFEAMFSRNFAEKDKDVIEIKEVDGIAMDAVLSTIYSDAIDITEENSVLLLQTASMFQFNVVETFCIEYLHRTMSPLTCLRTYQIGDRLSIKSLINKARCYAFWEFSEVKKSEAFLELSIDYLEFYLSSNLLRSSDELEVLEAAISWIEGPEGGESDQPRTDFFPRVLSCIRFSCMHSEDIRSFLLYPTIATHKMASNTLKCIIFLMDTESKEDHQSSQQIDDYSEPLNQVNKEQKKSTIQFDEGTLAISRTLLAAPPRSVPQVPCVVGHIAFPKNSGSSQKQILEKSQTSFHRVKAPRKDDSSFELKSYIMYLSEEIDDLGGKKVQLKPFLALSKINFGSTEASGYKVTSVGKDIFILGGQYFVGHGENLKSMWKFETCGEPGDGQWVLEGNLLNPRRHHSMCSLDGNLYLIGGFGKHRVLLDSVERYHIPTGTWHSCRSMPEPLYSAASCIFDGNMYVVGSQVYCYHIASNSWTTISELTMPKNTGFSSAMAYQDWIYLTGIYTTKLMRFKPKLQVHYKKNSKGESEPWTMEIVGNFRNKALNTCIVGCKIYSFGVPDEWQNYEGNDSMNHKSNKCIEIEVYDIDRQTFEIVWTGGPEEIKVEEGGKIIDFMTQHCAGCFSMIKF